MSTQNKFTFIPTNQDNNRFDVKLHGRSIPFQTHFNGDSVILYPIGSINLQPQRFTKSESLLSYLDSMINYLESKGYRF